MCSLSDASNAAVPRAGREYKPRGEHIRTQVGRNMWFRTSAAVDDYEFYFIFIFVFIFYLFFFFDTER